MATKSILKNITIRDKNMGRALVRALEDSKNAKSIPPVFTKMHTDVKGEDIKKLFGEGV